MQKSGITLIALVVTIIVLIILAAVSLNLILGQNGIISRAQQASKETKLSAFKEQVEMDVQDVLTGLIVDGKINIKPDDEEFKNKIHDDKGYNVTDNGDGTIILEKDGGTATVNPDWTVEVEGVPNQSGGTVTPDEPEDTTGDVTGGDWTGTVNTPVLTDNMTAVKWDGTDWVEATSDAEWYDYIAQSGTTENGGISKWANSITKNGSYLVWIPRYEYRITSGEHGAGLTYVSNKTTEAGTIDVKFIPTNQTTADSGYIIHPAFTLAGNNGLGELPGIWIGKFENSSENESQGTSGDKVKIVPNAISWSSMTVYEMYEKCIDFGDNNQLTGLDSHLMKNTEWSAVTYLAHSQFGRNGSKIMINNSQSKYTGRAGSSLTTSTYINEGSFAYPSTEAMLASSTGNITGVFDLEGGNCEVVMAFLNEESIMTPEYGTGFPYKPERKYYDIYSTYSSDTIGAGMWETSLSVDESGGGASTAWFEGQSEWTSGMAPIFFRGNGSSSIAGKGLFSFGRILAMTQSMTFRVVLSP